MWSLVIVFLCVCSLFPVDIWSVGCIMGEMVKGSVIFQGTDRILHCSRGLCATRSPTSSIFHPPSNHPSNPHQPQVYHLTWQISFYFSNTRLSRHFLLCPLNIICWTRSPQVPTSPNLIKKPRVSCPPQWLSISGLTFLITVMPLINRGNQIEAIQFICIYIGCFCTYNGFGHLFADQLLSVAPSIFHMSIREQSAGRFQYRSSFYLRCNCLHYNW